jgi:hypothetical protein
MAYARHLREQQEGRPWMCRPFARTVADLESGRPVAVRYWEVRRFAPDVKCESNQWVQLVGEDIVPVEPVHSADGRHITGWRVVGSVTRPT